ncbi:MAG: glycosyltransferase family 39 protein [Clostridia bacterium]|nr:glycosyltransferase family 39 protein [Clostridia bacterium]
MFSIFNDLSIIFVWILILIATFLLFSKNESFKKINSILDDFINKKYKIVVLFLFILTAFTSLYKLGIVPYGLHVDEAGMAYDAFSLSKYGLDRYLNNYPVYLINYGGGQSAMYSYLTMILFRIFGISIYTIRTPAVLLRLLTFISIFFIMKDEKNKYKTISILFLFSICPYFIMQSRWGLDCNLLIRIYEYFNCTAY